MFGKNNDMISTSAGSEDTFKIHVLPKMDQVQHDAALFKDAAQRVVYQNCMEKFGL